MALRKNTKNNSFNLVLSISVPGFTVSIHPNETKTHCEFWKKCEHKKQIIVKEQRKEVLFENHRNPEHHWAGWKQDWDFSVSHIPLF